MKKIPAYTKVLNLGSLYTENALVGNVILQEKLDGSQLRFGINENGELLIGTRRTLLYKDRVVLGNKLFNDAINYLVSIKDKIRSLGNDIYFFGEYLSKPKHNTLKYNKIPTNHIMLFDAMLDGRWAKREELEKFAKVLEIDVVPEFYRGKVVVEDIKKYLDKESYLGGEKIEGVVIKNYNQTIILGGKVFPLFTKFVAERFREKNNIEWKKKNSLDEYINSFRNENRWKKAYQYLRDAGKLKGDYTDLGELFKRVNQDIEEEEKENIKEFLYKQFKKKIFKKATEGLVFWYKEFLLKNLNEEG